MKFEATRLVLWTLLVVSLCISGAIGASPSGESAKYHFKIDSQPLGAALQELAKQSGVQIIFFSQVTEGHQAPSIKGLFTLTAALEVLLCLPD